MRRTRAFTLIELIIVVVFISILAGLLLPKFIKTRRASLLRRAEILARQAEARPQPEPAASEPVFPASQVHLRLHLQAQVKRDGLEVASPFQLVAEGEMRWRMMGTEARRVQLRIPFPDGCEEASDVRIKLSLADRAVPQDQLHYGHGGVDWSAILEPGQPVVAQIHYLARGRNALRLPFAQGQRLESLQIELTNDAGSVLRVDGDSLPPTSQKDKQLIWDYTNLVSSRPLALQLPSDASVEAQVLWLCRLVGLAVLIYGAGFWYLGELYKPGRLARFNWGNFLLLALNYSFFFPVFAVLSLGMGLPTSTSLGVAALLSLPLLSLHVWRVVDVNFSLINLVLAVCTLGLVINGVFGGSFRLPIYLAAAFVCVAFVTLSYSRWVHHRRLWQARCEIQLSADLNAAQGKVREIRQLCEYPQAQLEPNQRVQRDQALELVETWERLLSGSLNLESLPWDSCRFQSYRDLRAQSVSVLGRIGECSQRLQFSQHRAEVLRTASESSNCHCVHCGREAGASRFCPHCGSARPLALLCGCGQRLSWAREMMVDRDFQPHCLGCGDRLSFPVATRTA